MRFLHRTVYQLTDVQLQGDPWVLLKDASLESIDADYDNRLRDLGFEDVVLQAVVTADDDVFREIDARTLLADRRVNELLGKQTPRSRVETQLEELRSVRRRTSAQTWLVIDVGGEDSHEDAELPEIDSELDASFQIREQHSFLLELSSPRATELHHFVAGAFRLAAGHDTHIRQASQGCWHVRPDGKPHFRFGPIVYRGHAHAIKSMQGGAGDRFAQLIALAHDDAGIARAFTAFGQSLESDLGPTLEFLAAFTALELLTKSRTRAREPAIDVERKGLRKRFEQVANQDPGDCRSFDRLYDLRNGLAHEARFDVWGADESRRLFGKYVSSDPVTDQVPPDGR